MYQINNKFTIGDECYSYYRKPVHYPCPICEGKGNFQHNGYTIICKNCSGSGKLHNAHQTVAEPCKVKIRSIKATVITDSVSIRYVVKATNPEISIKNRSESNLFQSDEACIAYCRQINTKEIVPEF